MCSFHETNIHLTWFLASSIKLVTKFKNKKLKHSLNNEEQKFFFVDDFLYWTHLLSRIDVSKDILMTI